MGDLRNGGWGRGCPTDRRAYIKRHQTRKAHVRDRPQDRQARSPPAAQRALAEAAERRARAEAETQALPRELGGRDGPEPVRYGDWEKKGLAIDF
ncbi:hypothetical protein KU6B_43070 [Mameliella alba]|nr:hypothetical protein KU6B_43070 [Mameliella alba]